MRAIYLRRLEAVRRGEERVSLEVKKRSRSAFRMACKVASSIHGSSSERAAFALAYLGSQAGFGWPEIKRMLGEK